MNWTRAEEEVEHLDDFIERIRGVSCLQVDVFHVTK